MIWILAFTIMLGGYQRHYVIEPFPTLVTCTDAANRIAILPRVDPPTCTLSDQRPA